MRKTISTILVLVMVLSVFTSFGVSAEHWAQPSIDFVTQNGYWIAPEPINPDKVATRAETASLFARALISKIPEYNGAFADVAADNIYGGDITAASLMGLVVGNGGLFRPNDSLTREELACIVDRAAKMVSEEFDDTEWNMEFYKDGDDVSAWANQSVQNATKYVLMKGKGYKLFDPKGIVTIGEVATVVSSVVELANAAQAVTTTATSRALNSGDKIQQDYDVIQSGGIVVQGGYAGYGMMVRFDGTPGDIYVSRKTNGIQGGEQVFAAPAVIVKVVDPDGNTVIRENMYYKETGLMERIINIPNGKAGIYRIQFTSGLESDICTIGVKNPVSWGVFGENALYYTESTPKKGYLYVPKKHMHMSLGIEGRSAKATLWNEKMTARIAETPVSTGIRYPQRVEIAGLGADAVYALELADNFRGKIGFTGIPKVICPTAEMAWDLKGGVTYYEDEYTTDMEGGYLQLRHPIAVRARKKMLEIYEEMDGDFTVTITKPELKPIEEYDNVQAETQLHSHYFHSINNMIGYLKSQVHDPRTPYFGMYAGAYNTDGKGNFSADYEPNPQTWEYWNARGTNQPGPGSLGGVGALTINAETNAYYANPVLLKRMELQYLAWAMIMNETGVQDPYAPKGYGLNGYMHGSQTFTLGDHTGLMHGYGEVRNWLSPDVRAITDEVIFGWCEIGMNCRGQGPNNQAMMGMVAAIDAYKASGMQHFKDDFEGKALGAVYPSTCPNYIGQTSPLGYWQESGGSDGGSYGRMSEGMYDVCCIEYFTLDEKDRDPYVMAKMLEGYERFAKFDALFYCPDINGFGSSTGGSYNTAAFTAREPAAYGGNSAIPGNTYLINYSPSAWRAHIAATSGYFDPETYYSSNVATAGYICANDYTAYKNLQEFWPTYDEVHNPSRYTYSDYGPGSSWRMYRAFHVPKTYTYADLPYLPHELPGDYNIYDPEGGAIAIKHKGLYVMMYYDNDIVPLSGYSWLTSAPSQIWDEYFGTISSTQKPPKAKDKQTTGNDGRRDVKNDIRGKYSESELHGTGVVGLNAGGQVFQEGKECEKEFTWIEKGKSFQIAGNAPFDGYRVIWRYYLTDEGIEMEGGLENVPEGADLYVQIPLLKRANVDKSVGNADVVYSDEDNTAMIVHKDKKTIFSWDESVESKFEEKLGVASPYRFLKLKITPEKPMVRIKMTREMGDYVFEPLFKKYKDAAASAQ